MTQGNLLHCSSVRPSEVPHKYSIESAKGHIAKPSKNCGSGNPPILDIPDVAIKTQLRGLYLVSNPISEQFIFRDTSTNRRIDQIFKLSAAISHWPRTWNIGKFQIGHDIEMPKSFAICNHRLSEFHTNKSKVSMRRLCGSKRTALSRSKIWVHRGA